jgi:hypothetical protein
VSKVDQFGRDAEAATNWSRQSNTEKKKQALIELARRWTQAALQSESAGVVNGSPPERKAPPPLIFYGSLLNFENSLFARSAH